MQSGTGPGLISEAPLIKKCLTFSKDTIIICITYDIIQQQRSTSLKADLNVVNAPLVHPAKKFTETLD